MNEDQLKFCGVCQNRKLDFKLGLICSLTGKKGDFENECPKYIFDEKLNLGQLDEPTEEIFTTEVKPNQNFSDGLTAGIIASIFGAILWGIITILLKFQFGFMALAIGAGIGYAMKYYGGTSDGRLASISIYLAIFSCLLGNLLGIIGMVAGAENVGFLEALFRFEYSKVPSVFIGTISFIDFLMYGVAGYWAYRLVSGKSFIPKAINTKDKLKKKGAIATSTLKTKHSRIKILDGYRALAALAVVFYHYFSRWTLPNNLVNLYPYEGAYYSYFKLGYMGVHLFFIISGFVIFFSLENTDKLSTFWKKRFLRLWPTMIVASIITFVFFRLFGTEDLFPESQLWSSFIPSFTFTSPTIWIHLFRPLGIHGVSWSSISGSYWSLWPEMQFYIFVSIIYFLDRKNFLRNFLITAILVSFYDILFWNVFRRELYGNTAPANLYAWYIDWIEYGFNLPRFLPFFALGVLFYAFYEKNLKGQIIGLSLKACLGILLMFILFKSGSYHERATFMSMAGLFLAFIYFPEKLSFFENKYMTKIGESSYFLYLIHEHIGVFLIANFAGYFLPYGFVFSLIVVGSLVMLSLFFTMKIDRPFNNWFKNRFLKVPAIKLPKDIESKDSSEMLNIKAKNDL
jgi:peptidoglycan/LPS O-acetylase OafA/YrhL